MKRTLFALLASVPLVSQTQVNPEFADLNDTFELIRNVVQFDRRVIVTDSLLLTPEENNDFWPIYNDYRADIQEVHDRTLLLITDFAANYESLPDDSAREMLDEYLDIEDDLLRVRTRYVRRFDNVLPPVKLLRFYQIENKLDVVYRLSLADQIPLAF